MSPFFWIKLGVGGTLAAAIFIYVFHLGNSFGSSARELARINAATEEANKEVDANNSATEQAIAIAEAARRRITEDIASVPDLPRCVAECGLTAEARERLNALR